MSGPQSGAYPAFDCPCCEGYDDGPWRDLCDRCMRAALENRYPHGCQRPIEAGDPRPDASGGRHAHG
jgi:hypothetical protein